MNAILLQQLSEAAESRVSVLFKASLRYALQLQTSLYNVKINSMTLTTIKFKDWTFEVDKEQTQKAYSAISGSGADTCGCYDCKNYFAYRDMVFPKEIIDLFSSLGIDFRKEVEITAWETLPSGLHHIGGWFHFKGQVLTGKDYRVPLPSGGHTLDLTLRYRSG